MISRTAIRGDAIQDRSLTALAPQRGGSARRRAVERVLARLHSPGRSRPGSASPFVDLAERAIEWLSVFQAETAGRPVSFDEFWDRFGNRGADVAPPLRASYRSRLQELSADLVLRLGPIHGDFNHLNVLMRDRGASVVDWEYGESESFPPFDALNFFLQGAIDAGGIAEVENVFGPSSDGALASTTRRLLTTYAEAQGYTLDFVLACAPLFVLDLLERDYGVHEFPLRSADLFVRLLESASASVAR
jgi:aminoglycoside phosphotransferase (APT) family kinase protein